MPHAPLIIDIAGTELNADDRRRLAHPLVGGLIYFGRNWRDRQQITALSREIKALRPDLLIAVDHEGGRVQRFRTDGLTHLPPMRALGAAWRQGSTRGRPFGDAALRACRAATACGFVLASELRACGVDFSFTPVLDLDHGASHVIGDRAFDRDPHLVAALAQALMHGLLRAGMAHCGKHFPGHGHVRADSHVAIPVDRRSLRALLRDDAQPYAWLADTLTAVMPAHVIYPQVDVRPAGFSARWLQEILRGELGYRGAIVSDDLSMQGARQVEGRTLTHGEAVLEALQAGCDLALLCNQSLNGGRVLDEAIARLEQAQATGEWVPQPDSDQRRRALLPVMPALDWNALMADSAYRLARERIASLA